MYEAVVEKHCVRCARTKLATEFHKLTKSRDGLQAYCKECNIASARGYFDEAKIAKRLARERKRSNGI